MKKVLVLLMAFVIAIALFGCNIAPNVPRVTPYVTGGTYTNPGGTYVVPGTANRPTLKNAADKDLVPYVRGR